MTKITVGSIAPSFSLADDNGRLVSSSDLLGQRYVLYFYPADDTPGCTTEACQFTELIDDFIDHQVQIYGVSPDDAASHQAFRSKFNIKFTLLCDPEKTTMAAFGAYGEKMLYGKKVIGVIRSTFLIASDGTIERAWYGPKTDGHAGRVLQSVVAH